MKPPKTLGLQQTFDAVQRHLELVSKTLGRISFGSTPFNGGGPNGNSPTDQNMDVWKASGTTPGTPNTTFTVSHNLYRVPWGFIIVRTNAACHIYDAGIAWTAATNAAQGTISLKCDTASIVYTIIIH